MLLSGRLFWDVDPKKLDMEKHARFVITRVLCRGTLGEFHEMLEYYGISRVKEQVRLARYLDPRTLSFCSHYFRIPIEEFRCYTTRQSMPAAWDC